MENKLQYASYAEIASVLGISRQAVGYKMHGKGQFTMNELMRLYEEYGITMWELAEVIEQETKKYNLRKEAGLWKR